MKITFSLTLLLLAVLLATLQESHAFIVKNRSFCRPQNGITKARCQKMIKDCRNKFNIEMKWVGIKPCKVVNKGGCQCGVNCKYLSPCGAAACNQNARCHWTGPATQCEPKQLPLPMGTDGSCPPPGTASTFAPSAGPTAARPSVAPTVTSPSVAPSTTRPSTAPSTSRPSVSPTGSDAPSVAPSTTRPSAAPSTARPSQAPTGSDAPSVAPSTTRPSTAPSTTRPSTAPSTTRPSTAPSTTRPSTAPSTSRPSVSPTGSEAPSAAPSTARPSVAPSTTRPSTAPSTSRPSASPTGTEAPSAAPSTTRPSVAPSTTRPSAAPSTTRPSTAPSTTRPSTAPSTSRPSSSPTTTEAPSAAPITTRPSTAPSTTRPSVAPTSGVKPPFFYAYSSATPLASGSQAAFWSHCMTNRPAQCSAPTTCVGAFMVFQKANAEFATPYGGEMVGYIHTGGTATTTTCALPHNQALLAAHNNVEIRPAFAGYSDFTNSFAAAGVVPANTWLWFGARISVDDETETAGVGNTCRQQATAAWSATEASDKGIVVQSSSVTWNNPTAVANANAAPGDCNVARSFICLCSNVLAT